MRLSVATNFDNTLLGKIKNFPIEEVYGKLTFDFVGGGRSSYMLSPITKSRLVSHIKEARRFNIKFNYLLNSSCLNNVEFTKKGQKNINKLLDFLSRINVDSVTVSMPFLLELIKKRYPHFSVRAGVFTQVDSVAKAKYWENLGADCICLDSLLVNREFETLTKIRQAVKCDLQLLVNNNCLSPCPFSPYHMNVLSHSSQSDTATDGFCVDYCYLKCSYMKLQNRVNYLKSDWIRPEDISSYETIGYNNFKIVERNTPTDIMAMRVKAYAMRRYDGNLLDLIQPFAYKTNGNGHLNIRALLWKAKILFRPDLARISGLLKMKRLIEKRAMLSRLTTDTAPIYIDNRKLDGFLEFFKKESCRDKNCQNCLYCNKIAEDAVLVEPQYLKECLNLYDDLMGDVITGRMWFK